MPGPTGNRRSPLLPAAGGAVGRRCPVSSSACTAPGPGLRVGRSARPPRGGAAGIQGNTAVARSGTWWDREAMARAGSVRRAPRADAQTQARGGSRVPARWVSVWGPRAADADQWAGCEVAPPARGVGTGPGRSQGTSVLRGQTLNKAERETTESGPWKA